ncbi:MAG: acyltransferase [Lachnospiraceae bacterium]|nr:acyltransferase [Hungatella sp.]MCI8815148.1 acyltransferase [Lachnospiraceae bacterium]
MAIRIINFLRSEMALLKYKVLYGKKFSFAWSVRVGKNFRIRISNGGSIKIEGRTLIRDNVILHSSGGRILLGKEIFLNDMVCLNSKGTIKIDDRVIIGQNVTFYDHDHDYKSASVRDNYVIGKIYVGFETWIGSQCCILKGSDIGSRCVIGAQSIVKEKILDNTIYYQKRVKTIRRIEKC